MQNVLLKLSHSIKMSGDIFKHLEILGHPDYFAYYRFHIEEEYIAEVSAKP